MAWDLKIDPITQDFVRDGAGGWETTEHGDTAVLHQLVCHYDAWWGDQQLGSRLHDRDLFTTAPAALVVAEVERALGVLIKDALIADLEVTAAEVGAGRVDVRTIYRLVASGQDVEVGLPTFGGA